MKSQWKKYAAIGISIFLLYLCIYYWPTVENIVRAILGAAAPLFIGCVIAYVVNIPMSFFERHYFPKSESKFVKASRTPVCMIIAFLIIAAVITTVSLLVIPQLGGCIRIVFNKLPGVINDAIIWLEGLEIVPDNFFDSIEEINWMEKILEFFNVLVSGVGNVAVFVKNVVFSVFSILITTFLATIFAIYLLLAKKKVLSASGFFMRKFSKIKHYDKAVHVFETANNSFHQYIVGQCTEAVILGALCTIGMLILRLPYAPMIGSLTAVTALIPIAGAWIGGGVGAIMIFTVSPIKALIFLIFILVLQQLENNIIFPKVVGTSLGMPSLLVLAAVTIGGGLAGVIGMIVSVPLGATIYKLLREHMENSRASDNKKCADTEQDGAAVCDAPTEQEPCPAENSEKEEN